MVPLGDRWRAFRDIVLDPWAVFLLIATIGLGGALVTQTDTLVVAVFTCIVSLTSGILGGVIAKKWSDLTEEKVIVARGKSAVRSLKLLLGNIGTLDRRVRVYLKRHAKNQGNGQNHEVIKTYLEEVVDKIVVLEDEVVNAIEDWTDLVPGADVKTQIGLIRELWFEIERKEGEKQALEDELKVAREESQEEAEQLRKEIREKEKELTEARQELQQRSITLGTGILSSGSLVGTIYEMPRIGFGDDWDPNIINVDS
jgi:hypothetical protein